MLPPVYAVLKASSSVVAIVGNRIYPHGEAVQDTAKPYIVWQLVAGTPQNTLSEPASIDAMRIQIDCYHQSPVGIETLADAVRTAIETVAHVTSIPVNERETETKLYRIALDLDWWYTR
jgi:hypothetical protein